MGNKRHFEFEVEEARGAVNGRFAVVGTGLAVGALDGCTAHDDARGSAVVAHGNVLPVGQQCVVRIAEHLAHIAGVVLAAVKVGVVTDVHRQVQNHFGLCHEHARCVSGEV